MDEISSLLFRAIDLNYLNLISSQMYSEKTCEDFVRFAAAERGTSRTMARLNLEISSAFKSTSVYLFRHYVRDNFVRQLSDSQIAWLLKNKAVAKTLFWRSDIIDEVTSLHLFYIIIKDRKIKSIMKLVKTMGYCKFLDPERVYDKMRDLAVFFNADYNENYMEVLNTYCFNDEVKLTYYQNMFDLEESLSSACESKRNSYGLWQETVPSAQWPLIDFALQYHILELKLFLSYGAMNRFSLKKCFDLKLWLRENVDVWFNFINESVLSEISKPSKYLCYQMLCLFSYSQMEHQNKSCLEEAANLLWRSIEDPYLTKEDFGTCFERPNAIVSEELQSAWKWYKKCVLNSEAKIKSPRSLLHLSRCVVRVSLTRNFELPNGVKQLPIPATLMKYLILGS